jgi:ferritin
MLKKSIEDICNRQVEREFYSSLLYLAMASWTETKGYAGIAEWLYEQAEEEKMHMLKFVRYINERGGHAIMPALKKPPVEFGDINKMFDEVLEHEKYISESINEIVALTVKEKDFATNNWLQWFVSEQVEEESSVQDIIDKLNLVGKHNMYMFDRDILGMRAEEASAE